MNNLKKLREEKEIKQIEVANYLGVTHQTYSKIEKNIENAKAPTLVKLAKFFNVSIDYILGLIDDPISLREEKKEEKIKTQISNQKVNRLKELRKSKCLTQNDVAKVIFTTQQNYSRYEQGIVEPDYETLKKLATFFEVTIDYILGKDASDLILISKKDFQKLKEASEVIQKLDKVHKI